MPPIQVGTGLSDPWQQLYDRERAGRTSRKIEPFKPQKTLSPKTLRKIEDLRKAMEGKRQSLEAYVSSLEEQQAYDGRAAGRYIVTGREKCFIWVTSNSTFIHVLHACTYDL